MLSCVRSFIGSVKNKLLRSDAGKRKLPRSAVEKRSIIYSFSACMELFICAIK